jgi:3-hydroxyacyl-CoA dehydrogenase
VNEARASSRKASPLRASDIDMVYLTGYGFPLHRGGPMLYADQVGLYKVVRSLRSASPPSGADASWQARAAARATGRRRPSFN